MYKYKIYKRNNQVIIFPKSSREFCDFIYENMYRENSSNMQNSGIFFSIFYKTKILFCSRFQREYPNGLWTLLNFEGFR